MLWAPGLKGAIPPFMLCWLNISKIEKHFIVVGFEHATLGSIAQRLTAGPRDHGNQRTIDGYDLRYTLSY